MIACATIRTALEAFCSVLGTESENLSPQYLKPLEEFCRIHNLGASGCADELTRF